MFNDLIDCEEDKKHPKKSLRGLPSGSVSRQGATALCILLAVVSCVLVFCTLPALLSILFIYLGLNVLYSLSVKHTAVVDIILVAFFYVIRIMFGGIATDVPLSPWIILATFFLALFLVTGKRKGEYLQPERRKVLGSYAPQTLDSLLIGSAALALASYGLWSVLAHPSTVAVYSVIPVAAILFRMMNNLYLKPEEAESPEIMVFTDHWVSALAVLSVHSSWILFYV